MKHVSLKAPAWINGALRHPHEGPIRLTNDEAARLIKADTAEDVSADFDNAEDVEQPAASLTADPAVAGDGNKSADVAKKGDAK